MTETNTPIDNDIIDMLREALIAIICDTTDDIAEFRANNALKRYDEMVEKQKQKEQPKIVIKGMTELTLDQAVVALDSAMTIIESVGTTAIDGKWKAAHEWMKRYYPNWS